MIDKKLEVGKFYSGTYITLNRDIMENLNDDDVMLMVNIINDNILTDEVKISRVSEIVGEPNIKIERFVNGVCHEIDHPKVNINGKPMKFIKYIDPETFETYSVSKVTILTAYNMTTTKINNKLDIDIERFTVKTITTQDDKDNSRYMTNFLGGLHINLCAN